MVFRERRTLEDRCWAYKITGGGGLETEGAPERGLPHRGCKSIVAHRMIALAPDEELRMADDKGEGFKGKFGPRRAGQERRSGRNRRQFTRDFEGPERRSGDERRRIRDRRKLPDRRKPSNRRETTDRRT